MEYGQLMEYSVRNSFKKSCRKWDFQTLKKIEKYSRPFSVF